MCIFDFADAKLLPTHHTVEDVNYMLIKSTRSQGFLGGVTGKESACQAGDTRDASSIPELGSFPGVGNGNPL